jgi:hypothetical protein
MEWIPDEAWLTKVVVDARAGELDFDLAIDASGAGAPSAIDAGYAPFTANRAPGSPIAFVLVLAVAALGAVVLLVERVRTDGRTMPPAAA